MHYKHRHIAIISAFAVLLLVAGCAKVKHDARLLGMLELANDAPKDVLDSLKSFDYDNLSEADRNLYDLLEIKATDKAYITHTSDSAILKVIEYSANHEDDDIYTEALYYGGRVYRDLGDSHTALNYFKRALDRLDENTDNKILRTAVLSQTARLLTKLRLYNEAIPYVEKSIKANAALGHCTFEVTDMHMLGNIYLHKKDFEAAEHIFRESLHKSQNLSESLRDKSIVYLAGANLYKGQIDSALIYIRQIPESRISGRNSVLAYACEIYYTAGIIDTAYMYARMLIESKSFLNKRNGYNALLMPEFSQYVGIDSLRKYALDYGAALEKYLYENEDQLAINQQSLYNYNLHVREKEEAVKRSHVLTIAILIALSLVLAMGVGLLYLKIKNKNQKIRLQSALENIQRLEYSMSCKTNHAGETLRDMLAPSVPSASVAELKAKVTERLNRLGEMSDTAESYLPDERITQSEAYRKLIEHVKSGTPISYDSELWHGLEAAVAESSPDFIRNLQLLIGGTLNTIDLHTSLLVKCGVRPNDMARILNRAKSTIVSRRTALSEKILGKKISTKAIDDIIRSL